jgi:hypothetical protein
MKKLITLFFAALLALNVNAQNTCASARILISSVCKQNEVYSTDDIWYKFIADTAYLSVEITNNSTYPQSFVKSVYIYNGNCATMNLLDSTNITGVYDKLNTTSSSLNVGDTIFIRVVNKIYVVNGSAIPVDFNICINVTQNIVCNSTVCPLNNPTCDWICNGDFEYFTTCPFDLVQLLMPHQVIYVLVKVVH